MQARLSSDVMPAMLRMKRAGVPATTLSAATSRVTTAPAATMALSPMVIPGSTMAPEPIQTFRPMTMGQGGSSTALQAKNRD